MVLPNVFQYSASICLSLVLMSFASAHVPMIGQIKPEFAGSSLNWIDNGGMFLFSNNSVFSLGFITPQKDNNLNSLVIIHYPSSRIVWTANRGSTLTGSDKFVFDKTGNAYLEKQGGIAWSTATAGKGVTAMKLLDSGNLVLIGNDSKPLWQSFSYPTDTLLPNQIFFDGMRLVSEPNINNFSFYLEMKLGKVILYGGFKTPQPYWSLAKEMRKIINNEYGEITSASISNSWKFFDRNQTLVQQFVFSNNNSPNLTWAAVLGSDGFILFYNLQNGGSIGAEPIKIPNGDQCSMPEPCGPYGICENNNTCRCFPGFETFPSCNPWISSPCNGSKSSEVLLEMGDEVDYFALEFITPFPNFSLSGCVDVCLGNCSCLMLFFENKSGNCFLFDEVGSLRRRDQQGSSRFLSYTKIPSNKDHMLNPRARESSSKKHLLLNLIITSAVLLPIVGLLFLGVWYHQKSKRVFGSFKDVMGEEDFSSHIALEEMDSLSHMPIRFQYKDLQAATNNFSVILGHGGFGSVYKGMLKDGTQIAVKKLEGVGQGKKEFQAEITTIGSIRHVHLVKLRGFCKEGTHCLLAYEYMTNGSLDRWIFNDGREGLTLDWETRFKIALGMAKGLAYLHEGCSVKIVHCDIKPENVLLDDNYQAKISDFGLVKLMTREQSCVVTMARGTRGYLAPEWVTDIPISEKSDVYSFGMVLLEIIGGRRNFKPEVSSEKAHFPTYALRMLEEGRLKEILDSKLNTDESDERVLTATKVALWCIQRDMSLRPSMGKVVQMLEGSCAVALPPQMVSHFFENFVKPIREECVSVGSPSCHSGADLSDAQLSGSR
ncbi:G-type lectin S-receptor-like serine/threonine-protein kinase SD2-5 isoform X2 [Cornus florida]|uniref:G-type lectin S-receptor-like serine/threonine-protein kinase SD2-5 isoform X2 n=1 Tax=Cornus florida TaxID=4283 RepID=UPI0028A06A94|nr:G-type lectin S-receptor-like serine/threonine-protein kinase SD2-5 isoform X2 [Cornus florida]